MEFCVIAGILGVIPAMIAKSKGREATAWWLYGVLLFPIALVHSILIGRPHQICPQCRAKIPIGARICMHCRSEIGDADDG